MKTFVLFCLLFVCLMVTETFAATFTVNQAGDASDLTCDATCTLRDAIDDANAAETDDTISFAAGVTNITLTKEILINNTGTLTINGNGANVLTIDGGAGTNRIFTTNHATVTITGVTLTGGNGTADAVVSGPGGAIYANGGTLVLNGVHITANSAAPNFSGGGVMISGGTNHQILNSTVSANTAIGCTGIFNNGGVLTVTNSTVSGNLATEGLGGGICNGGDTTLRSVTVTGNSALAGGGGIRHGHLKLNVVNSIVAGNTGGSEPDIAFNADPVTTITTAGYNLIGNNSSVEAVFPAGNPNAFNDIVGTSAAPVNPVLGPLENNGGTTPTHALLQGSQAINTGSNSNSQSTTDQRGFARIVGGIIDIGAYESNTPQTLTCSFLISPSNQEFTQSGGTGTVTVTAFGSNPSSCPYGTLNELSYLTINSGGEGAGNGTVSFTIAPNTGAARTGTIFIAGQNFTISQAAGKSRKRVRFF